MSSQVDETLSFSMLFNLLYEHVRDDDGNVYTDIEVAQQTGMSPSSISALRRSITGNPRLDNVKAVARFFGVPLNYFGAKTKAEAIDIIAKSKHNAPPNIELATRLTSLSDEARDDLERILRWVQKADNTSS